MDEVPLEWCFSDGVVLDMRHKPDGSVVTVDDVKATLKKINYNIKPFDIVLIMTGVDKYWGTTDYLNKGCGMGRESTIWLCDQGVKIMGIDSWKSYFFDYFFELSKSLLLLNNILVVNHYRYTLN
ncbi:MAG: cyclase family protein [Candidatus Jordarchaeum sp.]|uniref:cyclase family protein n=1 Tax=Candidatus Jordarchaeum sp. TaxID=2823881 RepID=UPI00404A56A0